MDINQLLQAGNYKEATVALEEEVKNYPHIAQNWYLLSYAYQQNQEIDKSFIAIKKAQNINPLMPEYRCQEGVLFKCIHDFPSAIDCFLKTLELEPKHRNSALYCAQLFELQGEYLRAEKILSDAIIHYPNDEELAHQLKRLNFFCGKFENLPDGHIKADIKSIQSWVKDRGGIIESISPPEAITVSTPKTYGTPQNLLLGKTESNSLYLAELENIIAWPKTTLLLHHDKSKSAYTALSDILSHPDGDRANAEDAIRVIAQRKDSLLIHLTDITKTEEKGIMLFGEGSIHYGHWLYEYLPKIKLLDESKNYKDWPIFIDSNMPSTHRESLLKLVGPNRTIREMPNSGTIFFKKILYPSFFVHLPMHLRLDASPILNEAPTDFRVLKYLQTQLRTPANSAIKREKLYLSRKNAAWRKLSNEIEIETFLMKRGFRTISTENLSFEEMLTLFSTAETIVGASGSAMNNIIFAPTDCRILVLSPPDLGNYSSWENAVAKLGYDIAFICGTSTDDPKKGKHADFKINLKDLRRALGFSWLNFFRRD